MFKNKTEQEHTYVRFAMKLDNLKLSKQRSEIWNIMPYEPCFKTSNVLRNL